MPNFEFIKKSLYRYSHFFYFCLHIMQCPVSEFIPIVLNITKICVNVQCILKYTYKKHKHTYTSIQNVWLSIMVYTCEYTYPLLLFFWEDTKWTIDDSPFKKSGYVGDKNHFLFHVVPFIILKRFFHHQLIELLLKEGSLVTFGVFSLCTFLYENVMRCYWKVGPSYNNPLMFHSKTS